MGNPQSTSSHHAADSASPTATRRDFIMLTANAMLGVGAASCAWPFISSMNPSADVLAMSTTEMDLSSIAEGQSVKTMWRGKPVFVRRRTSAEIEEARKVPMSDLPDPQEDQDRVQKGHDQWLVMVGVCTHLGCVPLGQSGDYNGWFCPCHGSHYDTSGRIRKGPAPRNLMVPEYTFTSDTTIVIGLAPKKA